MFSGMSCITLVRGRISKKNHLSDYKMSATFERISNIELGVHLGNSFNHPS